MRIGAFLGIALLLAGCATGFNRQAIEQRLADQPLVVNDSQIQSVLNRRPQLRFPIKVAVHLAVETYHPNAMPWRAGVNSWPASWRWTAQDRECVEQWAEPLRKAGIIADLYVMSEMVSPSDDRKSVRLAAAEHGADVVLFVKGVSQVDSYVDGSAVLNLLILPGYVVPSSHRDALFVMHGAMWDVGNECLYLSVDAEGEAKTRAPTFRIKEDAAVETAKETALGSFGDELQKRMLALQGTAPAQ